MVWSKVKVKVKDSSTAVTPIEEVVFQGSAVHVNSFMLHQQQDGSCRFAFCEAASDGAQAHFRSAVHLNHADTVDLRDLLNKLYPVPVATAAEPELYGTEKCDRCGMFYNLKHPHKCPKKMPEADDGSTKAAH